MSKNRETWILWHGGTNYACGYVADDAELLPEGWTPIDICLDRLFNRDGSTPAVEAESSGAHVFHRDPRAETDPYPDELVVWSGYHNGYVMDVA